MIGPNFENKVEFHLNVESCISVCRVGSVVYPWQILMFCGRIFSREYPHLFELV